MTKTLSWVLCRSWWKSRQEYGFRCYGNPIRTSVCCDGILSRIWRLAVTESFPGVGRLLLRKSYQEFGIAVTETLSGVRRLLSRKLVRNPASAVTETLSGFLASAVTGQKYRAGNPVSNSRREGGGIDILIGYLYLKLCIFPKFSCPGKLAKLTNCDPVFWLTFEYLPGYALNFHANTPSTSSQKIGTGSSWSECKIYAVVNRSANTM